MKRTIAIAILLGGFCGDSFAQSEHISIAAPLDKGEARGGIRDRPELKPLHAAYTDIIRTRLWPLRQDEIAKIFGPKLGPSSYAPPEPYGFHTNKRPSDMVLPIIAPEAPVGDASCAWHELNGVCTNGGPKHGALGLFAKRVESNKRQPAH